MLSLPISLALAVASHPITTSAELVAPAAAEPASPSLADVLAGPPPPPAPDEEGRYDNLYHKFSVNLGTAFYTNFQSTVQVSGSSGVGAIVDFEDLMNVNQESTVGRADMKYAFNERHLIRASYFDIRRSGTTPATTQDIEFGDITIPAGSRVSSEFDTRIIKLAYQYNFVTDDRTVIGASFGIHSMGLRIAMEAGALDLNETFSQELPLPLIGLHGAYALSKKWSLLADIELLQVDLGDIRGAITDATIAVHHDTFDHFGWGVGINAFSLDGTAEGNSGLKADVEYGYQGILVYLRYFI